MIIEWKGAGWDGMEGNEKGRASRSCVYIYIYIIYICICVGTIYNVIIIIIFFLLLINICLWGKII